MAIQFGGASPQLKRSSDLLNFNNAYTVMGWFRPLANAVDYDAMICMRASDNNEDTLQFAPGGLTLSLYASAGSGNSVTGSTLSQNTWYHLATVRESTTSCKVYVNGVLDITSTNNVAGRSAINYILISGYNELGAGWFNGVAAHLKAWSRALTADQVKAESATIRPVDVASLYGWWPVFPGATERVADYSGYGRTWSTAGTLTDVHGPPVSWGSRVWVAPWVKVAGTLTATVAGVSSVSGAASARKSLSGAIDSGSAITSALAVSRPLASAVNASSGVTGVSALERHFGAAIASTSTVTGIYIIVRPLAGTANGVSAVTSNLPLWRTLTGTTAGQSAGIARLTRSITLASASAGVSGVAGELTLTSAGIVALAGAMVAESATAASLALQRALAGWIAAESSTTGALSVEAAHAIALAGMLAGESSAAGTLHMLRALSGYTAGQADVHGQMQLVLMLAAQSNGVSTLSGNLVAQLIVLFVTGSVTGPGSAGAVDGVGKASTMSSPGHFGTVRSM